MGLYKIKKIFQHFLGQQRSLLYILITQVGRSGKDLLHAPGCNLEIQGGYKRANTHQNVGSHAEKIASPD